MTTRMKRTSSKIETDYYFDQKAADEAVNWIEKYCTHVKGEWGGGPLLLEKWQKGFINDLFGWKNRLTGKRKYRRALVFVPRKNGKSTLGSAIALYLLCGDAENGPEVYSVASDRLQAGIIHSVAKEMVYQNQALSKRLQVYRTSIIYDKSAGAYLVLSADAPRQHGKNSHGIIFDELHTQPNRDLWDVMATSTGSRQQPLMIAFTTAGFDKNTICFEQYEYAKKVRDGIIKDPTFLPVIYEADENDDIYSEATWKKANPNYKISLKEEYIRTEAARAKNEPAYENTFRRLQLNQWTTSETKWINDDAWMKGQQPFGPSILEGKPCTAGLDLASTRDICALVLSFAFPDGKYYLLPFFFIPELTARERTRKDGVNYDLWIKQGLMIETPGNVTDYDLIRNKLNELKKVYNIQSLAYDRWNASQLVIDLQADGFTCNPFGQGYASMSAPTKQWEQLIYQGKLIHGGNAVLRWMNSNIMILQDPAGNIKVAKDKSTEKVDGIIAGIMALGENMTGVKPTGSIYNDLTKRPAGVRRLG